uniref:Exonuclease 1 n=1 Tax=Acrobeloides nanus TaxID=290746 RepID=A0A914D8Q9_9BILA
MGINKLMEFVGNACRPGKVNEFRGQTIAVDASVLLHKGVFGCIEKEQNADMYVNYVKKHVDVLLKNGCHVILVFDGLPLPAKQEIHAARRENREKNRKLSDQHISEGNQAEANKFLRRSVTITREIAMRKVDRVDILVAPYEADAQLMYLTQIGIAHAILTIDTDLIVYGCEKILFKMDLAGSCLIYERSKLSHCVDARLRTDFDFSIFRRICILSGCDYLKNGLPNVGLQKAHEIFIKLKNMNKDIRQLLRNIPVYFNRKLPHGFIDDFIRAERTFLHQIVFDPIEREQKPLNPYPDNEIDLPTQDFQASPTNSSQNFAGTIFHPSHATRLALGNSVDDLSQPSIKDQFILCDIPQWSIWHTYFKQNVNKQKKEDDEKVGKYGAFQLPITSEKVVSKENGRKRSIQTDDDVLVALDEECEPSEKKICTKKFVGQMQTTTLVHKNGVIDKANADDWLRCYGSSSQESANSKNSVSSGYQSQTISQQLETFNTESTSSIANLSPRQSPDSIQISLSESDNSSRLTSTKLNTSTPIGRAPALKSPYFSKTSTRGTIRFKKSSFDSSIMSDSVSLSMENATPDTSTLDRSPVSASANGTASQCGSMFKSLELSSDSVKELKDEEENAQPTTDDPLQFIKKLAYRHTGLRRSSTKILFD